MTKTWFALAAMAMLASLPTSADSIFFDGNASVDSRDAYRELRPGGSQQGNYEIPSDQYFHVMEKVSKPGGDLGDMAEDPRFAAYDRMLESSGLQQKAAVLTQKYALESMAARGLSGYRSSGPPYDSIAGLYGNIRAMREIRSLPDTPPALKQAIDALLNEHRNFDATYSRYVAAEADYRKIQPPSLRDQFVSALDRAKSLDTVILDGHSSGYGVFSNTQDGIDACAWRALANDPKYKSKFAQVREVVLMGCYMGTDSARKFWHEIFPNAAFIAGYASKAPIDSPESATFMKETLRAGDQALQHLNEKGEQAWLQKQVDRLETDLKDAVRRPVEEVCRGDGIIPDSQKDNKCDLSTLFNGVPGAPHSMSALFSDFNEFSTEYFPDASSGSTNNATSLEDPNLVYKCVRAIQNDPFCISELSAKGWPSSGAPLGIVKGALDELTNQSFALRSWRNFSANYRNYFSDKLKAFQDLLSGPKYRDSCQRFLNGYKNAIDISGDWFSFYRSATALNEARRLQRPGSAAANNSYQQCFHAIQGGAGNPGQAPAGDASVFADGITAIEYALNTSGATQHPSWLDNIQPDANWRDQGWSAIEAGALSKGIVDFACTSSKGGTQGSR